MRFNDNGLTFCNCNRDFRYGVPCRHIFAAFLNAGIPLCIPLVCHPRWQLSEVGNNWEIRFNKLLKDASVEASETLKYAAEKRTSLRREAQSLALKESPEIHLTEGIVRVRNKVASGAKEAISKEAFSRSNILAKVKLLLDQHTGNYDHKAIKGLENYLDIALENSSTSDSPSGLQAKKTSKIGRPEEVKRKASAGEPRNRRAKPVKSSRKVRNTSK